MTRSLLLGASLWATTLLPAAAGADARPDLPKVVLVGDSIRLGYAPLVAKRLAVLDFIEGRLRDPRYTREYGPGEADALRERIAEARREYQRLAPAAN